MALPIVSHFSHPVTDRALHKHALHGSWCMLHGATRVVFHQCYVAWCNTRRLSSMLCRMAQHASAFVRALHAITSSHHSRFAFPSRGSLAYAGASGSQRRSGCRRGWTTRHGIGTTGWKAWVRRIIWRTGVVPRQERLLGVARRCYVPRQLSALFSWVRS